MRKIGVNKVYLRKGSQFIILVDDYRPAKPYTLHGKTYPGTTIDRRYMQSYNFTGCLCIEDYMNFESKEDGNAFYSEKTADGFVRVPEKEFSDIKNRFDIMSY